MLDFGPLSVESPWFDRSFRMSRRLVFHYNYYYCTSSSCTVRNNVYVHNTTIIPCGITLYKLSYDIIRPLTGRAETLPVPVK